MLEYKPSIILSNKEYKTVGKRAERQDAYDKVTGKARYGADVNLPGLLHGKIVRSPHSHARILSIDSKKAMDIPGVHAVITGYDLPVLPGKVSEMPEGAMVNMGFWGQNVLAREKALYKGHAIAAIAADSAHLAEEAAKLIDVQYEVLPHVSTAEDAMKANAPLLHERLGTISNPALRPGGLMDDDDKTVPSNVANEFEFVLGDVEAAFKNADVIVETETKTSPVHQGYIEPHSGTAMWHDDGKVTVWSSSQGHFMVREQVAKLNQVPLSDVKAVPNEIGGGFGAKTMSYVEPLAALLAKKAGRPVKIVMGRKDVLEATGPTSGTNVRVKLGATKEGKLIAGHAVLIYEAGAFPGSPVSPACQCIFAPYNIPNAYIKGIDVVVNRPKATAYRAPGAPTAAFAMEIAIDQLCEKLEVDPMDFRLENSAEEGTRRATGPVNPKVGFKETVDAIKNHPHYTAPLEGKYTGRGVASGFWFNGTGPATAMATVNPDGTVNLIEGSADIGGTRTTSAMQFAETLGISVDDVKPQVGDTDTIGFTSNTGGSGVTFKTGMACHEAALDIKSQILDRGAKIWDVSVDDVEFQDGVLSHKSDPELKLDFKQIAARMNGTGGPLVGRAGVTPPGPGPALATHVVDVEVDVETGKITILRYTAAQDVGKAIHPSFVEGQIQGGVVQGIGWALNEEYYLNDDGHMMNASFLDYRMPISLDLPMIDTVIVEVANPNHPYGVRGVGEVPICPPMAAIANAVYDAIGVRVNELPMKPGTVLNAILEISID
ncbi:MAG: xanthine dehydrogenase family protein molybdopterin-binding subunit [Dehalococcoidia bacterium]